LGHMRTPHIHDSFGRDTTRRSHAHRRIHRDTFPPTLADMPPGVTVKNRGPPSEVVEAPSKSMDTSSAHDMDEIGPLRTALTLATQVNSAKVEHQYTSSRCLLSALYPAVCFALQCTDVPQNPDIHYRTPKHYTTCSAVRFLARDKYTEPDILHTVHAQSLTRTALVTRTHSHLLGGLVATDDPTTDRTQ